MKYKVISTVMTCCGMNTVTLLGGMSYDDAKSLKAHMETTAQDAVYSIEVDMDEA